MPRGLVADELTKLARLRDEGVLSEAEFTSAKTRLLAGL
jgi:Short C-terminal domain